MSNVIPFPGAHQPDPPQAITEEEIVRSPIELFAFSDSGQVDLVDGVTVTDAVTALWGALQDVVRESWADHPLARERARVQLLSAYLDREHPGWRNDIVWQGI